jgi:hypothetical protein
MTRGFQEVSRTHLLGGEEDALDVIIETGGPNTFRLYMEHRVSPEAGAVRSTHWVFTRLERAEVERDKKVEEALSKGWRMA